MTNETDHSSPIFGYCAPAFKQVEQAFRDNFSQHNEVGACVSVVYKGEVVVDLWGGFKDKNKTKFWKKDSLVCVMSVSKAIASLAVLKLADDGIIDLDKPIAKYWPEFGQNGKEAITIRCMLSQLAGLPVAEAAPEGSLFEKGVMTHALEIQRPLWPPGTTPCYHSFTHGPLCQELVFRSTGKSLGQYLREDLFAPYGIEFYLGMTEDEIARCADIIISEGVPTLDNVQDPTTLLSRAWKPMPQVDNLFQDYNFRTNEFGSGNGHSNARNLAKLFGMLSELDDNNTKIISKGCLENAIQEQWDAVEVMTNRHFRYSSGFMLNNPCFKVGKNPRNFGHPGLGGANAFADPDAHLGFAYACNLIHPIDTTGPCASALIDAVYRSI